MNGGETDWQLLFWLLFGVSGVIISVLALRRRKLNDDEQLVEDLKHEVAIRRIRNESLEYDLSASTGFVARLHEEGRVLRERIKTLTTEVNDLRQDNENILGYARELEEKLEEKG